MHIFNRKNKGIKKRKLQKKINKLHDCILYTLLESQRGLNDDWVW